MTDRFRIRQLDLLRDPAALLAGALLPLGLSPFDYWPVALLGPACLFWVTWGATRRCILWRFYLFNVGMFATGISWIFVSINVYGGASEFLAGFLVALFVLLYSLVCLPQAMIYGTWFQSNRLAAAAGFMGLWVLQEWFRGWFLTGFPWLFLGYSVMETPLANFAPILGVFGVSLAACACSVFVALVAISRRATPLIPLLAIVILGYSMGFIEHTRSETSIAVSLVQGNVDQHTKWRADRRVPILNQYLSASQSEWGRDLVVWPEAAITIFRDNGTRLLSKIDQDLQEVGTTLLTGIPDRNKSGGFENTVLAVGDGSGQYIKRRLVPFGEYVPLESILRGLIRFFDLPMSRNTPGPSQQPPLLAGDLRLSVSICYEVVYPDIVRQSTVLADLLVTVSNDTWFGSSIGPWQHLQMARMRALENGRSMVRATNNGVTALIDYQGRVLDTLPQFERGVLRGDVDIRTGTTPFNRFGSLPVLCMSYLLHLAGLWLPRRLKSMHGDAQG